VDKLRALGLLDESGALTPDGVEVRETVEAATDELAATPWQRLGETGTARLTELGRALSREAAANGAFPPDIFSPRR
jgi:hypothetical protein